MMNCKRVKKEAFSWDKLQELLVIVLLVASYIVNVPILTLATFLLACSLVVFSKFEMSIYHLAFFTSFASIFMYNGKHMFFVMVALFIFKAFLESRVSSKTCIFYILLLAYSAVFCDFHGEFSFAKVIGIVLLFAIPVIANFSDRIDCNAFMQHYIWGFVISTMLGFFVKYIPSMYRLFDVDIMWTENYQPLVRFFGVSYDANFYALSNYVVLAYLLLAFEKTSFFRGLLSLALLISGILTISKSYFLVVGMIFIIYVLRRLSSFKHIVAFAFIAVVGSMLFSIVSDKLGYNAIELITSRFTKGDGLAALTTGRSEIWKEYIDLFKASKPQNVLFGFGFNATASRAAHNTVLEFLFHYGFVGIMLWGSYFVYCFNLFRKKTTSFKNRSPMVCFCLIVGTFFLSAYTFEAFWIGIIISMMTWRKKRKGGIIKRV